MNGELLAAKQVQIPETEAGAEEEDGGALAKVEAHKKTMFLALQKEINFLEDLYHENIVRYLGSEMADGFFNILLEYVPGGSVSSMLSSYGAFSESLVRTFVKQILAGLGYLHDREIIHRDIKGGNILVDNKGVVKISDFGISQKVDEGEGGRGLARASLQGSVFWMAPEVVKKQHYTRKADIWSLGCLVVEMFTGEHPFPEADQMQAIFRIGSDSSPDIPEGISDVASDFLTQTFITDYAERPTAQVLLKHPFLQITE
ncbi:kinase-like domain-containing protein [Piptocephalis cylindrospora]|uniref:Kinase-like domain-containing protein n=1 Tax=Piptocephalis cylindrospora TaxID=1907219 RepID=A0A4V1IXN5_9FUNG|nr:kinase-like domain-containing protein [Piptocephalis cylindrospora]|eukprot:RKP11679.1 kinase-like domain-containing protein [Piptocephalis cylindrospora]